MIDTSSAMTTRTSHDIALHRPSPFHHLLSLSADVEQYVGTLDAACDHIGQGMWMAEMPWTGQEGFVSAPTVDWHVDGELAGSYKTSGNLSVRRSLVIRAYELMRTRQLVKVYGAGHLVPTDQPKVSHTAAQLSRSVRVDDRAERVGHVRGVDRVGWEVSGSPERECLTRSQHDVRGEAALKKWL